MLAIFTHLRWVNTFSIYLCILHFYSNMYMPTYPTRQYKCCTYFGSTCCPDNFLGQGNITWPRRRQRTQEPIQQSAARGHATRATTRAMSRAHLSSPPLPWHTRETRLTREEDGDGKNPTTPLPTQAIRHKERNALQSTRQVHSHNRNVKRQHGHQEAKRQFP